MRPDKRTSNLFIAGGYCLVAIIILVNYLQQADVKEKSQAKTAAAAATSDESSLSRQLKEEKRVNQEMRAMLTRLQSMIVDPKQHGSQPSPAYAMSTAGNFDIPDINHELFDNKRPRSNPFIPGRNPFAAPSKKQAEPVVTRRGLAAGLRCDPNLPFVVSGSGSRSAYQSNF